MASRIELTPLTVDDADEMVEVLGDPALYAFIGGTPPALDELRERYKRLAVGRSEDGTEEWFNWIVRQLPDRRAVGTVQATEAASALVDWLNRRRVGRIIAHIHPDHHASNTVARRIGLEPTDHFHDGERRWLRTAPSPLRRMRHLVADERGGVERLPVVRVRSAEGWIVGRWVVRRPTIPRNRSGSGWWGRPDREGRGGRHPRRPGVGWSDGG